ncbi:SusC/RagA family TonB-linked outer membrane protein [Sphingobacterium pedocola]|uniref:TonB-dependent receptor plug domain-containing protein n=1 Tax=Sphingobacterium pedocola TaxID=2082722 RepID=A0ABR9T9K2_9SPHI|nr:SusC/RagA family TonB-linked outer membrane protein [Sphingobacterium pedocola]MBE8722021.1 hypothetical protein [Sphingobacterium pedocola]
MRNFLLLACCWFFLTTNAQPTQQAMVLTVLTNAGDPIGNASVAVAAMNWSAKTDTMGRCTIPSSVRLPGAKLTIAYIGFRTQSVSIDDITDQYTIRLAPLTENIEEVLVSTGYQVVPKERTTGSYATVDRERLDKVVATDIISKIDGLVPGMLFNRNSTRAITLRGQSTLFSDSNPLIVLDNFPYEGDIMDINPNDVENITVLRDAAAASIWGAQAANGVIVITTIKGKRNQALQIDLRSNIGIAESPNLFYQPKMSTASFVELEQMLFANGFYTATENSIQKSPYTPIVDLLIRKRDDPEQAVTIDREIERLTSIDVRDDLSRYFYRPAVNQQHALNIQGGGERNSFYLSLGYDRNREELIGNSLQRVSINARNTLYFLKDRIRASLGLDLSNRRITNPNIGVHSLTMSGQSKVYPYARLVNDDGGHARLVTNHPFSFIDQAQQQGLLDWSYRPLDEIAYTKRGTHNTLYRVNADVKVKLLDGLEADVLFQYGNNLSRHRNHRPQETYYTRNMINNLTTVNPDGTFNRPIPLGGILGTTTGEVWNYAFRSQLNYNRVLADEHSISALAGFEVRDNQSNSYSNLLYGYDNNLGIGSNVDMMNTYPRYVDARLRERIANNEQMLGLIDRHRSFYGNSSYSFRNRYIAYGSVRLDQSNLFGVRTNQKGVPLWSVGGAYVLSEESFYRSTVLPYLKLKASYGYNGNINKSISAFTTVRYQGTAISTGLPYARIVNPPNPELRWERVKVYNAGLEFRSRNNWINGNIELYRKQGLDLIGEIPYAPSSGVGTFTENYANTKTHGLDVQLSGKTIGRVVQWNSDFMLSLVRDEVTHYLGGTNNFITMSTPIVGRPQYAVFSYPHAGLDPQSGNPVGFVAEEPSQDYAAILQDINENNIIYHGSERATTFGSFRNTIQWKGLVLTANIVYRTGYFYRRNTVSFASVLRASDQHGDYEMRWQQPGDEAFTAIPSMPAVIDANRDNFYANTDVFVEPGDHIRLKDINLAYNFPSDWTGLARIRSASLYLYVNNVGVLWKKSSVNLDPDYPYADYAPPRIFTLGINIKL